MKKSILMLSMVFFGGNSYAADFTDTAQVVSSTPVYERISEPRRECTMETVQVASREHSMGGAIMGGVAGGVLGSQVGKGSGSTVATGAGAVAGAVLGDRVANPDQPRTEQVERCRQVETSREVIKGYNVTYRYNGQNIVTTLPYQPGSTIRVGISAIENQPARYYEAPQKYRYENRPDRRYDD